MAWIVKNATPGIVMVTDLQLTFGPHQVRDVDILGRETAQRSFDLKQMLDEKKIVEVKKDPSANFDPQTIQKINEAAVKIEAVAASHSAQIAELHQQNTELKQQNNELNKKVDEVISNSEKVLNEVRIFAEKFPIEIKTYAEAMRNAMAERVIIADKQVEIKESGSTEDEIEAHQKILAIKDKKLQKNIDNIGKTLSNSSNDVQESLDALDALGI